MSDEPLEPETQTTPSDAQNPPERDRRAFIGKAARTIAYAAPVVMLFKAKEARAGSGDSLITPG